MKEGLTMIVVGILLVGGAFWVSAALSKKACTEMWHESALEYKWGFFSGCLVRKPGEGWLPESAYREVE